ncbi:MULTISPECIES: protein translocase subunit SecD [Parasutterella]|jgi:preprotein translocase subunit SecD|uniref:Protein translocase subunit SecD n=6 Tax=Parasutterella TaxID=577310 RepID=F3QH22_9BURK|nr:MULTISPECIES: protein translocase subunit SecD [Parasutterella]EFL83449.1 export membrane protein SecD [Burkholderiales bacterium 1_1_47]RHU69856.1 protein translocase subunit SecD [Burkholderiales bacterium]HCO52548.1 protein translocase subunit SecD [Sutterellaceae bacterium]EGG57603.1 export membrane protein SecD [Parasutterella excrementihominis YIT 11859]MBS5224640.1 protein translocase subunit SecD [Parasutterella sp.]
MNRYPLWKYILIAVILIVAAVYTLPNFYGESPAVQVSPGKATVKVTEQTLKTVEDALAAAQIKPNGVFFEQGAQQNSVRVRFAPTDGELQLRSRDVLEKALNPDPADPSYIVALNLVPNTPTWLLKINALPMYLGLDLRGGVHFLLAVDMKAAVTKRIEAATGEVRTLLRDHKIRHAGIVRVGDTLEISFRNEQDLEAAMDVLRNRQTDLTFAKEDQNGKFMIRATMSQKAMSDVQSYALKQNVATLHNRINELGVAEPVIAQQGADRIVVQLPGVQDTAKAKDILGRTATLEVRMVDDSPEALAQLSQGTVPFGTERFKDREGRDILVKRQVVLTGDNLNDAQPGFDNQTHEPTVNLTLDAKGARIFKDVTRENVGKRMAIILFEKGKGEVVTAPVIRQEIGGGRVQISGRMTTVEATDTALLLRAGSLAAPMEIIEERLVGPSLGAANIKAGFESTLWGFIAVSVFMVIYYHLFGVFSAIALTCNLFLLVAILSMLQATLTLPGIAAMALTLGMAVDANVLINERIREELRENRTPQQAIKEGYDMAFNTILDSNITSLIAGIALLIFGSGPVRGFAVVHCLGILTSIFTSVMVSRALVNLWYGRRKKLTSLSIGQIWRPDADKSTAKGA